MRRTTLNVAPNPRTTFPPMEFSFDVLLFDNAGNYYSADGSLSVFTPLGTSPITSARWNYGFDTFLVYGATNRWFLRGNTSTNVLTSTNGTTWTTGPTAGIGSFETITEASASYLFMNTPAYVYTSRDGGVSYSTTFNTAPDQVNSASLLADSNTLTVILPVGYNRVALSTDFGTTFSLLDIFPSTTSKAGYSLLKRNGLYTTFMTQGAGGGTMYRYTSSNGTTWTQTATNITGYGIGQTRSNSSILVGSTFLNTTMPLVWSEDSGLTWNPITGVLVGFNNASGSSGGTMNTLAYNGTYFFYRTSTANGLAYSRNGKDWSYITHPTGARFLGVGVKYYDYTKQIQ